MNTKDYAERLIAVKNALGMEGADMYQNQLAKLSGSLDSMSTAGGIDFDGDGQVDISAEKPGVMMKYTEEGAFKVQDDIPPWFIWVHHIGFHTYSYRIFMYNEFEPIKNFEAGAPFASGTELLKFYSFDTVDVSRPPPRHLTTLHPLPCYIPLLGGSRPRCPRRLWHLLPRVLRSRPVLLPHRTSLRAQRRRAL